MTIGIETPIMRVVFAAFCVIGTVAACHGCTCVRKRAWSDVCGAALVVGIAAFWALALFNAGWL